MTTSINPIHPSMSVNAPIERRFYPRITPSVPIYVAFGPSNLGALLNISENGFQVVTPNRLDLNSVYRVFLSLDGITSTITVSVRTIWTADSQNSSGIQLLDLSDEDRQQIRNWVAARSSPTEDSDNWSSPNAAEVSAPAPGSPSPEETEPPVPAESATKREFPPMPLPIHGEFTYEPPSEPETKILLRRERQSRHRSRSSITPLVMWSFLMVAICAGAGWSFRRTLADKLLPRHPQIATEATQPEVSAPASDRPERIRNTNQRTSVSHRVGHRHESRSRRKQ